MHTPPLIHTPRHIRIRACIRISIRACTDTDIGTRSFVGGPSRDKTISTHLTNSTNKTNKQTKKKP
jgi:hypothetical protein